MSYPVSPSGRCCGKSSYDEVRATYLSIAQIWLQAAARLDGGLPIRGGFPVPKKGEGKLEEPEPS